MIPHALLRSRAFRVIVIYPCAGLALLFFLCVFLAGVAERSEGARQENRRQLVDAFQSFLDRERGKSRPRRLPLAGKLVLIERYKGQARINPFFEKLPGRIAAQSVSEAETVAVVKTSAMTRGSYSELGKCVPPHPVADPLPYWPTYLADCLDLEMQVAVYNRSDGVLEHLKTFHYSSPRRLEWQASRRGWTPPPDGISNTRVFDENGRLVRSADELLEEQVVEWLNGLPRR
jgi:hypothetical protein